MEKTENIDETNLEGKFVIVKTNNENKVFFCKFGFGCMPGLIGTKIFGYFVTEGRKTYIRRPNVARLATDDEVRIARENAKVSGIKEPIYEDHI